MKICETCEHAIFDPLWGEYKCDEHKIFVPDTEKYSSCPKHEKGEPKLTKVTREDREQC
jgi:hypothetical protein